MSLKQSLILIVFSFSAMIFASSAFAVSGNWLVCGNTECPGCSSANWDNCIWDGYNQYCPSSCNGGYYNCGDGYCNSGAGENWNNCPTDCSSNGYSGYNYGYNTCSNLGQCGTYPNCYSCGYATCDYDGYCDSWESSSCSDCNYNNNYNCNYYGNCGNNNYYCSDLGQCGTYPTCYSCNSYYSCSQLNECGSYPNCYSCQNYNCNYYGNCGYSSCSNLNECGTYPNCYSCGYSTCNHQNPNVVISPNSQQGTAGSTLTYTVTVTNNDVSNCGSSTFSLTPTCPSGWNCYLDTNSLSITPGGTLSTTLRVTSINSAGGTNSISVTASYSSGGGTGYATYFISGPSQNCNYALSISPNSGSLVENGNWYITATDSSSGCTSPITYTVSYTLSGDCDSSSYGSPSSFTISQGSSISNIITVRAVKRTNTCTVSLNIQSPTGSTVASGSYSVNQYGTCTGPYCGNNYYPQNYYPQYYYPYYPSYQASSYSMDTSKEIETATVPCSTPYEGQIPKATVYAQSSVSTPNESVYIILILALLFLLLLFALIAFLRWLMSRDGRRERTYREDKTYREDITYRNERREKDGKRRKSSGGFICWNKNGRDSPECF